MSSSSSSSSESNSRATSRENLKDVSTSNPTNEDRTTLPAKGNKCETGGTAISGHASSDVSPSEKHREDRDCSKPSGTTAVRQRYKTHSQMIKEKLDQIKAEMQRISKVHLHQRPERKAYHPFVWNTLGPYRDTTEIDHLLTTTADPDRRNHCSSVKGENTRLSK